MAEEETGGCGVFPQDVGLSVTSSVGQYVSSFCYILLAEAVSSIVDVTQHRSGFHTDGSPS